jgi:hypothetical protein
MQRARTLWHAHAEFFCPGVPPSAEYFREFQLDYRIQEIVIVI